MSVWNIALGLGVRNNPLTDSPYFQQEDIGFSYPAPGAESILTEDGSFILTEGSDYLTTE